MPRFIVKTNKAIKDELRWRTGVVLEDDDFDCTALVRSDQEDRRIFLSFLREANRIVDLKPNFFGFGLNLNALADRFLDRKRKQIGEE